MFEKDRKIIKIDGKERFLEVTEFFSAGKVCFNLSTYNKNAQAGNKITSTIKSYFGLEDLSYLAHILEDETTLWARIRNKMKTLPAGSDIVVASFYSGSPREGQLYSRQFTIEKGKSQPIIIRMRECPGVKTPTGAVLPDKNRRNEMTQIIFGMSLEMCYKLSYALKRAIRIYDGWVINGVLNEKIEMLQHIGSNAPANAPELPQNVPQNNNQYNSQYNNPYNSQYNDNYYTQSNGYNNPANYQNPQYN